MCQNVKKFMYDAFGVSKKLLRQSQRIVGKPQDAAQLATWALCEIVELLRLLPIIFWKTN